MAAAPVAVGLRACLQRHLESLAGIVRRSAHFGVLPRGPEVARAHLRVRLEAPAGEHHSLSNSVIDLLVMYAIGVLGFFMRRYDFPVGPGILGVILGPLMEAQFRRALQVSEGDPTVFFTRPLSLGILLLALVALILPYIPALLNRLRGEQPGQGRTVFGEGNED